MKNRINRVPVSTKETGCIPFNKGQKAKAGYKVGETPVKDNGFYIQDFDDALNAMRIMHCAGWRDYGKGNTQSAHKAIGWINYDDAELLLSEKNNSKRISLFTSLTDITK